MCGSIGWMCVSIGFEPYIGFLSLEATELNSQEQVATSFLLLSS